MMIHRLSVRLTQKEVVIALLACLAGALLMWKTFADGQGNYSYFDLHIYYSALQWWHSGHPLYDYAQPDHIQGFLYFTYPPLAALLLSPLAWLSVKGAEVALVTVSVGCVFASSWLMLRHEMVRRRPRSVRAVFTSATTVLLLASEPFVITVLIGQINAVLMLLVLIDFLLLLPQRSRGAGVLLGVATAIKLLPGIFIVYLLVTKRWRPAVVACCSAAVVTLLVAAYDPRASWTYWTSALWDNSRVGRADYIGNQSMLGTLARWTRPDDPPHLLWVALVLGVLCAGLWLARWAWCCRHELLGIGIAGVVSGLISPLTWFHHQIWVLVVVVAVSALAWRARSAATALVAAALYALAVMGFARRGFWGSPTIRPATLYGYLTENYWVVVSLLALVASGVVMRWLAPVTTRAEGGQIKPRPDRQPATI